jgi:hypothetical protein
VRSFCQDRLAPVALLRYMVWKPRNDDARKSRHVGPILWGIGIVSPDCPEPVVACEKLRSMRIASPK